jgi:hypothetical protein
MDTELWKEHGMKVVFRKYKLKKRLLLKYKMPGRCLGQFSDGIVWVSESGRKQIRTRGMVTVDIETIGNNEKS